jgi:hypothetical protein
MTYDEIVTDYIRTCRDRTRVELRGFERERSLSAAIRRAALCQREDGKRCSHQRRIPGRILEEAELRLQSVERSLAKTPDFDAVHRLVDESIRGIDGIGPLTVYDIAHRIGAYLRKEPTRVYLHAGTKVGALALGIEDDVFDSRILPKPFSRLSAAEIEDCLCIYKDELLGNVQEARQRTLRCAPAEVPEKRSRTSKSCL